ncbi:hypothetical protein CANARDRAFT_9306 [[Candida] arabinofermentans NRRL YB-2248]|uniref:Copper-fist domain-containing protein n=1 Tax=[Candida] arabinofermentans NRRL YB-2248 TaxID=983967 RepID=A0A1E4SWC8_9ASCO|nr:hypothetical protein CANARDRAFT_9306 [[Candida] arabinofermentans NRRL YB-2248]
MILVEGEKYACEQCIRGHRSSTCKHMKRPLVLVRSRGRPLTDSTQRIAIVAEEVDNIQNDTVKKEDIVDAAVSRTTAVTPPSSTSCCGSKVLKKEPDADDKPCQASVKSVTTCKHQGCSSTNTPSLGSDSSSSLTLESSSLPADDDDDDEGCSNGTKDNAVILLKVSKRQVFNVSKRSLKLLEPVLDIPNNEVGMELIHMVSKTRKKHGKHHCKSKNLMEKSKVRTQEVTTKDARSLRDSLALPRTYLEAVQSMKSNPSTHIPADMNYPTAHPSVPQSNYSYQFPIQQNFHQEPQRQSSQDNSFSGESVLYDMFLADSCTVPGTCSCNPDKCTCEGCVVHRQKNEITDSQSINSKPLASIYNPSNIELKYPTNQQYIDNVTHYPIPIGHAHIQSMVPLFEQNFKRMLLDNGNDGNFDSSSSVSTSSASLPECCCTEDDCACYDCELHGIYEGIRLKDGVRVANEPRDDSPTPQPMGSELNPQLQGMVLPPYQQHYGTQGPVMYQSDQLSRQVDTQQPKPASSQPSNQLQITANDILDNLDLSEFQDDCCCPDDSCNCANCFKHGRFGNTTII